MGSEQKSTASNFTLRLGLASISVDVAPIRKTNSAKAVSLVTTCPTCALSVRGGQRFFCPDEHGPFLPSELTRARETEDGLVPLTADEVAELKDNYPTGVFEMHVTERSELAKVARPDGAAYRLRIPTKKGTRPLSPKTREELARQYDVFRAMASHPTLCLYGVAKVNGNVATQGYRLDVWEGQLLLQSLVRPQDLAELDEMPSGAADPKLLSMAAELMETMADAVDIEVFSDERRQTLAKILAAKSGEIIEPKAVEADDLILNLERALQLARKAHA